jgi:hypothetical protein
MAAEGADGSFSYAGINSNCSRRIVGSVGAQTRGLDVGTLKVWVPNFSNDDLVVDFVLGKLTVFAVLHVGYSHLDHHCFVSSLHGFDYNLHEINSFHHLFNYFPSNFGSDLWVSKVFGLRLYSSDCTPNYHHLFSYRGLSLRLFDEVDPR